MAFNSKTIFKIVCILQTILAIVLAVILSNEGAYLGMSIILGFMFLSLIVSVFIFWTLNVVYLYMYIIIIILWTIFSILHILEIFGVLRILTFLDTLILGNHLEKYYSESGQKRPFIINILIILYILLIWFMTMSFTSSCLIPMEDNYEEVDAYGQKHRNTRCQSVYDKTFKKTARFAPSLIHNEGDPGITIIPNDTYFPVNANPLYNSTNTNTQQQQRSMNRNHLLHHDDNSDYSSTFDTNAMPPYFLSQHRPQPEKEVNFEEARQEKKETVISKQQDKSLLPPFSSLKSSTSSITSSILHQNSLLKYPSLSTATPERNLLISNEKIRTDFSKPREISEREDHERDSLMDHYNNHSGSSNEREREKERIRDRGRGTNRERENDRDRFTRDRNRDRTWDREREGGSGSGGGSGSSRIRIKGREKESERERINNRSLERERDRKKLNRNSNNGDHEYHRVSQSEDTNLLLKNESMLEKSVTDPKLSMFLEIEEDASDASEEDDFTINHLTVKCKLCKKDIPINEVENHVCDKEIPTIRFPPPDTPLPSPPKESSYKSKLTPPPQQQLPPSATSTLNSTTSSSSTHIPAPIITKTKPFQLTPRVCMMDEPVYSPTASSPSASLPRIGGEKPQPSKGFTESRGSSSLPNHGHQNTSRSRTRHPLDANDRKENNPSLGRFRDRSQSHSRKWDSEREKSMERKYGGGSSSGRRENNTSSDRNGRGREYTPTKDGITTPLTPSTTTTPDYRKKLYKDSDDEDNKRYRTPRAYGNRNNKDRERSKRPGPSERRKEYDRSDRGFNSYDREPRRPGKKDREVDQNDDYYYNPEGNGNSIDRERGRDHDRDRGRDRGRRRGKTKEREQEKRPIMNHSATMAKPQEGDRLKIVRNYEPARSDEVLVHVGDIFEIEKTFEDGWCVGSNLTTNKWGAIPMTCLRTNGGDRQRKRVQSLYMGN